MKDDQRLFRALEQTAGRDGFDTIVSAAVASYGSLRSPGEHQARDFGRLVVPLWDKIQTETRRALAASLSHSPRVPRPIVELLIAEPLEVSAPFLTSSPALRAADLMALRTSHDRRLRKIIASRVKAGDTDTSLFAEAVATPAVTEASRIAPPPAEKTVAAPASHAAPIDAPAPAAQATPSEGPSPEVRTPPPAEPRAPQRIAAAAMPPVTPKPQQGAADLIRETLRRLARPGQEKERVGPTLHELVALAVQQDGPRFYEGLRQTLDLSDDAMRKIEDDASGERLAVAVKALGASPADALTVLMMMKPDIGLDVAKFSLMTRFYRALKAEDCVALTRRTPGRQSVAAPRLEPVHQDLEPLPRQAPPADFGRRAQRPFGEWKNSKSG